MLNRVGQRVGLVLGVLAVVGLVMVRASTAAAATPKKKLNVLFLLTDDQRADTIHALGNKVIHTPTLDKLADGGAVFDAAYCQGGLSPAVCMTSRMMILSGRSMFHLGQINHKTPEGTLTKQMPNFARSMRGAGYETWHMGKTHNTPHILHEDFEHSVFINEYHDRTDGFPGQIIGDGAVKFLTETRDKTRPFFMLLEWANPHDPRIVNTDYRKLYRNPEPPLPVNFLPLHPFDNGEMIIRDEALAPWPRTEANTRKQLGDYYGVITYMDMQMGRVLKALRDSGEYDNTIIIFAADQGLAMGSHGLFGKQNLYDDGMCLAPLLIDGPGISHTHHPQFVYLTDIYPTVCDLVGVPKPAGIDGVSFAPIVRGESDKPVHDSLTFGYMRVQRAIRIGDWKLIRYPRINRNQLFNIKDDPYEMHDLAADPAQASRVSEMFAQLQQQLKDAGDTLALTSEHPADPHVTAEILKQRLAAAEAARKKARRPRFND